MFGLNVVSKLKMAISALRLGLPVGIILEDGVMIRYFYSTESLDLYGLLNDSVATSITYHRYNFVYNSKIYEGYKKPNITPEEAKYGVKFWLEGGVKKFDINGKSECLMNLLCVYAGLGSSSSFVMDGDVLPKDRDNKGDFFVFTQKEIEDFEYERFYDLKYISYSPIYLRNATEAKFYVFRSLLSGEEHYAIFVKNPLEDDVPLVRIHSSCYTGDLLASLKCDCRDQLQDAISTLAQSDQSNGGIVLYIMQEGRGIGLANKIKAYFMQEIAGLDTVESNLYYGFSEDMRNFLPAVKILQHFSIDKVKLLTNNPKKVKDFESMGIKVEEVVNTIKSENEYNKNYLEIKSTKMGHKFK